MLAGLEQSKTFSTSQQERHRGRFVESCSYFTINTPESCVRFALS